MPPITPAAAPPIVVPPGVSPYGDPLGLGAEVGSDILKGIFTGQRVGEEEQYKRTQEEYQQSIKDMADIIQLFGPEQAVSQPEFQQAFQKHFGRQWPTQPGAAPGAAPTPMPIGGPDTSPTLRDIGISGYPDNVLGLTTRQAEQFLGKNAVSQMILQQNKMTEGEYDTQVLRQYHEDATKLTPQLRAYAEAVARKRTGEMTAQQLVISWIVQHPDTPIEQAPRHIQELNAMAQAKTTEQAAVDNVRRVGLANATPEDRQIFLSKYPDKMEPKTMDQMKVELTKLGDTGFNAQYGEGAADRLRQLAGGRISQADISKQYYAWQTAEIKLAQGMAELKVASHDLNAAENLPSGWGTNIEQRKERQKQIDAAKKAVSIAQKKVDEAKASRDATWSIYNLASQEAGYGPGAPKGTTGTPPIKGVAPTKVRTGLSRELVDKQTQSIIESELGRQKVTPVPGMSTTIPDLGTAVYDGTNWRWK